MHKYIIIVASRLEDSVENAGSENHRAVHKKKKWMAGGFDHILAVTDSEGKKKAAKASKSHILSNRTGLLPWQERTRQSAAARRDMSVMFIQTG